MASNAQASVPVPEGLNLDAWIVPPPREEEEIVVQEKKKKVKKGKEKETDGKKAKTSSKKRQKGAELLQDGDMLTPVDAEVETREERERVSEKKYDAFLVIFTDHYYTRSGEQKEGNS